MDAKSKIHAFYILVILLTIIVILVSVKWADIPQLVQYFSFALTMSSLLLAVIAIVYSFYSSTVTARSIASISDVSTTVSRSADDLRTQTQRLSSQIDQFPDHFKKVEGKVDETRAFIEQKYLAQTTKKSARSLAPDDEFAVAFLESTSFVGLKLIYYLTLIQESKKPKEFTLVDMGNILSHSSADYLQGYGVALVSAGLIKAKFRALEPCTLESVPSTVAGRIKEKAYAYAQNRSEAETKTRWLADLSKIESHVAGLPAGVS